MKKSLLTTTIVSTALLGLIFNQALAQEPEDGEADSLINVEELDEDDETAVMEKIVTTGTLLQKSEYSSAAPIQVLTAETATLEGLISTADLIQGSSIAAGSVQLNNQFGGIVIDGGLGIQTVSLRGLGDQRSLVLINGRRPGPSGTRGAVGAFDLNVIPSAAVTRVDILKDGASTIYGSDAVGGVVNVITRTKIEKPELNVELNAPFESGGESFSVNGAYGLNFDAGSVALSAQYSKREALRVGDRDFLRCPDGLIKTPNGRPLNREDRGINAGTPNANCNNIYANTVLTGRGFANRYIPSPDGVEEGPIPGYRLRTNSSFLTSADGQAYFEDDLYDPRANSAFAINELELTSLFATSDFDFDVLGGIHWQGEALYTQRETKREGWRQFFPDIGGTGTGSEYATPFANPFGTVALPIAVFPSNSSVEVDYFSLASTFDGEFGDILDEWSWMLDLTYSRSDGDYTNNSILADRSGDVTRGRINGVPGTATPPTYNPFDPAWLDGSDTSWYKEVQSIETGNTVYEQTVAKGSVTGPLFELPAGDVLAAVLFEGRKYSIDDMPSENSRNGNLWGQSSALPTKGEEDVFEVAAEIEIPLLKGLEGVEEFTINVSGRTFNYATYGTGDVWKVQGNWQIVPSLRARATKGTTFRAPALFETFQGLTTSFTSQRSVDPCTDWGESTNANLQRNCGSLGIPSDYSPSGASATIASGGGGSSLQPETSEAATVGLVFTPTWAPFSFAIDYFDITVENQIAQLGAGQIAGGCYRGDVFPNRFCSLIERNGADAQSPFSITRIEDTYVNINTQKTSGIDLAVRYQDEFDFGVLSFDGQATHVDEKIVQLFDSAAESGFDITENNGTTGDPTWVWNARTTLERGPFTYSWFMNYLGVGDNERFEASQITYQGVPAIADRKTEQVVYHGVSMQWRSDDLTITAGIRNLFDEHPPTISSSNYASRRGTVPLSSGYDLRGRRGFVKVSKTF